MKILAIDTCLSAASVAVVSEDKVFGLFYIDNKLTHSVKLIPLINSVLSELDMTMDDIDAIACTNGPGSFTGIRIGMATAKGLAMPCSKPIVTVSSLAAAAYNFSCQPLPVISMTDARNSQVFYGKYQFTENGFNELTSPSAAEVSEISASINSPAIICGDGAAKYREIFKQNPNIIFAPPHQNMPNAATVAAAAFDEINKNGFPPAEKIDALYVRKSSAEQEKERKNEK
ncbi:MAG: tRNA (adenosine(37)-N6)-threonylcarbamoyltransferase complex dimerization subunit type 1 TsaB [Clostridia bacterium]|nr:tRNA (adenosine(37)-N6)-threonylcarbamoyltransferase complex dimerization subunit type 1 TsaB [Clostridia bacterium]